MFKPNNYDNVKAYSEFEPLPVGGYVCKIMSVEETKSKTGKDMLKISLDIAEGEYKDYFSKLWINDTSQNRKWGCIVYQLVLDNNGETNRGLKTFHTSVEKSNLGFSVLWGNGYAEHFKGKLIGGLFRREEYEKQNGGRGWSVRCFAFRSVDAIREGKFETPKDKPLASNAADETYFKANSDKDYMSSEDDLPF